MKTLHYLLLTIVCLGTCSCSSLGAASVPQPALESAKPVSNLKHILPTSFLGKQSIARFEHEVTAPGGYHSRTVVEGYNTQNPDPDLMKGVVAGISTVELNKTARLGLSETARTTRHIDDNAVRIGDSNNKAATDQLRIKTPPPVE